MLIELAAPFNRLRVEVNKVSGTSLLWRDRSARNSGEMLDGEFLTSYSWVASNTYFTDETRIRFDVPRIAFAERYGGFGIGINGGGARVVNVNGAQIKGVGANALVGEGAPMSHSYGGLDIQGAVKEILYSRLLRKISPVGVQGIDGLILLDRTSALHNDNKAPSVLMVREPVARPAHFLPCISFRVQPQYRALMRSDYSRVLGIYKSIRRQGLLAEFYVLIQDFLDKCADQLSFFRMARLAHSALGPSNICLDGRVLDTALCSFVVSGTNYGQTSSYLEEATLPMLVAREWFYLVNKFLLDTPVEEHFLKLYEEKFYQYASVNLGFIFGLDREMATKISCTSEWRKVASRTLSLLSMCSPMKTTALPTVDAVDFFNDVITASLYSILNNRDISKASTFLKEFTSDLSALMTIMAPSCGWHGHGERSFYTAFAIQTIKRAILSSYFFITYIGRMVDDHYASDRVDQTARLIDENDRIADWLYENLLSKYSTIYSGGGVSISYSSAADEYLYAHPDGSVDRIANAQTLRAIVDANKNGYVVHEYDFYPYLSRLLALLAGDAMRSFNGVKNVFR